MEILEPGKLPVETFTGRCVRCRCLVRVAHSELVYGNCGKDYIDQPVQGYYVKCPTARCDKRICIDTVTISK